MSEEGVFRLILAVVLMSGLSISGYHRHRARRSGEVIPRGREPLPLILLRLLFTLPLFVTLVAYLVRPDWVAWPQIQVPPVVRWLGAVIGLVCLPLVYWVVSSLGRNISETVLTKRDQALVAHGPYRWIRHPLYSVGLLLLLASSLLMASWFVAMMTALGVAMITTVVIPREESALVEKFGERYLEYRTRTGGLIPKS